ncbi:unnamed protein product [Soboliphyme baturini]|uniref:Dynamin-binding protein n=1 Tax=Soboliphyme baturini TaxID=241478 RepID=A0A183IDE8_9BILA|nr:unnamed protein product [Soboliphyme baturini]
MRNSALLLRCQLNAIVCPCSCLFLLYRHNGTAVQRNLTFTSGDRTVTFIRDPSLFCGLSGNQRTLWCELAKVKQLGVLDQMDPELRKLQEAMFEVISSEASYLRSLNVLITHFMASPKLSGNVNLGSVIARQERKRLFSNILDVRDCSEKLFNDLEARLNTSVVLDNVCDILSRHLTASSGVYIRYCSNQIYQERMLKHLRENNGPFVIVLEDLEKNDICESLDIRSFLMLPMQRITRYPLLIAAIQRRLGDDDERQNSVSKALDEANRVVKECNEGAKKFERMEQLIDVERSLIYTEKGPKRLALISTDRWLVKRGNMLLVNPRRRSFGKTPINVSNVSLFLFTDTMVVAKPAEHKNFVVLDYCLRQYVDMSLLQDDSPLLPAGIFEAVGNFRQIFRCTFMQNHAGRQVELILASNSATERTRWLDILKPPSTFMDGEEERIYEAWDCPQVRATGFYHAHEEDEISLLIGDLINVYRKMPDGWYEGFNNRDRRTGWFPASKTEEVISDHIRAKHFRERLRVLHEAERLHAQYLNKK